MEEDKEEVPVPDETPILSQSVGGRTYYISIPIRPLSGHVPDQYLERVTLYYSIYGVLFLVAGGAAILLPLVFGVPIPALLAWLLVIGGSISLLKFILICGAPGTTAFILLGALHLSAGLWLLLQTIEGSTAFTFVLSIWFLAHGVLKLLLTIQVGKLTTWPVVLVSALASITLAFVILSLTPQHGFKIIALAFGGDLAFTGIAMLLISLMAYLGRGTRSVSDADAVREPLLGGGPAAASA